MSTNVNLTDSELDAIMEKIQKMLSLRDNAAATVGEAANAAAMIQKLLAQYNLSLSEIEQHAGAKRPQSDMGRTDFDLGVSQGYQQEWRVQLMWTVTRYNWCRAIFQHGQPGRARWNPETFAWEKGGPKNATMVLIGKAFNVRVCIELNEHLVYELDRLSRNAWKQYAAITPGREGKKTREYESRMFKMSFIKGAIHEIEQRLAQQYRESQGNAAMGALMVVSDAALSTEVTKHFPRLGHHKSSRMGGNADAYAAGQHAGRNISLTPTRKIDGATGSQRRLS
jgi:Protein of unknown function (DUF2786)